MRSACIASSSDSTREHQKAVLTNLLGKVHVHCDIAEKPSAISIVQHKNKLLYALFQIYRRSLLKVISFNIGNY